MTVEIFTTRDIAVIRMKEVLDRYEDELERNNKLYRGKITKKSLGYGLRILSSTGKVIERQPVVGRIYYTWARDKGEIRDVFSNIKFVAAPFKR